MKTAKYDSVSRLIDAGVNRDDAQALRRIAMTLDRWHELECGDANGQAVERDEKTNIPYLTYDLGDNGKRARTRIADREGGALKRLAEIIKRYPGFNSYVQGDPRGASLYILRPGDLPEGGEADAHYTRGIAVCK